MKSFIFAHFPTYSQIFPAFLPFSRFLFFLFLISTFVTLFLVAFSRSLGNSGENCVRLVLRGGLPERSGEPLHVACLHRKLRVSRIQVHIFVSTVQTRTAAKSFLDGIAGIKAAVSEVLPRFQRKCGELEERHQDVRRWDPHGRVKGWIDQILQLEPSAIPGTWSPLVSM